MWLVIPTKQTQPTTLYYVVEKEQRPPTDLTKGRFFFFTRSHQQRPLSMLAPPVVVVFAQVGINGSRGTTRRGANTVGKHHTTQPDDLCVGLQLTNSICSTRSVAILFRWWWRRRWSSSNHGQNQQTLLFLLRSILIAIWIHHRRMTQLFYISDVTYSIQVNQ